MRPNINSKEATLATLAVIIYSSQLLCQIKITDNCVSFFFVFLVLKYLDFHSFLKTALFK